MNTLVKSTDRAIAEVNRRFLSDRIAVADAIAQGDRIREQMEAENRLTWLEQMPRRWPAKVLA